MFICVYGMIDKEAENQSLYSAALCDNDGLRKDQIRMLGMCMDVSALYQGGLVQFKQPPK